MPGNGRAGCFLKQNTSASGGKKVFLRYHLQAIKDKADRLTGVLGIVEDITVPARA